MRHLQTSLENVYSVESGITALAGGGKSGSPKLTKTASQITVCATTADSVQLDFPAVPGVDALIVNDGAQSLTFYAQGTDTIDAVANGTGKALAAAKRIKLYCIVAGNWITHLGA